MRKSIYICCFILFTLMVLFSGCSKIGQKSPSETVKAFYISANEGKYSECKKYFTSPIWDEFGSYWKNIVDGASHSGTIERIEILKEEIRGEGARVYFVISFKDGSTHKDDVSLIKEDGVWKIDKLSGL
ncbi:MAG: DUF4878 domain-containing protein [candidate division Zixibacteria bacterium]|nr:DUF4878 domain-containing protein [candidate division Zixibacteria bacterium]MCK4427970.1 DUF4878 domain-containing protein [candidate division Zixibacteria bacterium]